MEVLAVGIFSLLSIWLIIRLGSHWHASRLRTLDSVGLNRKIDGLLAFGRPGSYLALVETESGDRVALRKELDRGNEALELQVAGRSVTTSTINRVTSRLAAQEDRLAWLVAPTTEASLHRGRLTGAGVENTATLESLIRLVLRELGHTETSRYKIEFEGPSDDAKVKEFCRFRLSCG